jgi:hypothetical protein
MQVVLFSLAYNIINTIYCLPYYVIKIPTNLTALFYETI